MPIDTSGRTGLASQPSPRITPAEYLEAERKAEYKSEYHDGHVFAMTGASMAHNLIVTNLILSLASQLRTRACHVYPSDMRVRVEASGLYTYPDVSVVCGKPEFEDGHLDTLLNPALLVEVLSPSTEDYVRGRKAEHYRRLESLREYLLVSQEGPLVERYRRQGEREWLLTEFRGLEETVELASIGCEVALREVYEKVIPGE